MEDSLLIIQFKGLIEGKSLNKKALINNSKQLNF